jgi:phosphoribosylaminoimidazole-succinocarboxamide synthase
VASLNLKAMSVAIKETNFSFPQQEGFYKGKVRDVYYFENIMAVVVTDRISAFDVVLPEPIPFKGQILNQIAARHLRDTEDIVPNWLIQTPHPQVTIGHRCQPAPIEMVIRGYLAGHAWREYRAGKRTICGVPLPNGLKENDRLPQPIITPTTKAVSGHDQDISKQEILKQGLVEEGIYRMLAQYTQLLFARGTANAAAQDLILVDTKYEFGTHNGELMLIDEIHTPDSSRYFYAKGYEDRQQKGEPQKQLSKEFVREWLMSHGFQGKDGQQIPLMTEEVVNSISARYIELFEQVMGETFQRDEASLGLDKIKQSILTAVEHTLELKSKA